jgi:alkanesulfonate monooxygenase SsuD/methylene tetrahydromethanopterin reductase-like flavin-dependent oxidoreductase (luciferase family)
MGAGAAQLSHNRGMQFAVNAPPFAEPNQLVELAVDAERAGWDAYFMWDHVVHDASCPPIANPWVVLGAAAVRTERIRLGTCVTPLARRRPQSVARETVTVDRLSNGRLTLGVGLGYPPEEEFAMFGEPTDDRVRAEMLDEALAVISGLWSGEKFEFDGKHFSVDPVRFAPTPVQQPRPPVWVACMLPARRPLARAARWDGVVPIKVGASDVEFPTLDDIASIADEIGAARGTLDGYDIVINAGPPPTPTPDDFAAAGATWWMVSMGHFPGWFELLRDIVRDGPPR